MMVGHGEGWLSGLDSGKNTEGFFWGLGEAFLPWWAQHRQPSPSCAAVSILSVGVINSGNMEVPVSASLRAGSFLRQAWFQVAGAGQGCVAPDCDHCTIALACSSWAVTLAGHTSCSWAMPVPDTSPMVRADPAALKVSFFSLYFFLFFFLDQQCKVGLTANVLLHPCA